MADALDISEIKIRGYSACDISDALLKLKVPNAGFIPGLKLYTSESEVNSALVGKISTAKFIDKTSLLSSKIPEDKHWADVVPSGTILIQSQPNEQKNAVLGGIMAARLKFLGVSGIITHGRIRDVNELESIGLPIWAKDTSTVGQGLSTKCESVNEMITLDGHVVFPGDVCVADLNGVVVIPQDKVKQVLKLLPIMVSADEKVMQAVKDGMSVKEAFAKFR